MLKNLQRRDLISKKFKEKLYEQSGKFKKSKEGS